MKTVIIIILSIYTWNKVKNWLKELEGKESTKENAGKQMSLFFNEEDIEELKKVKAEIKSKIKEALDKDNYVEINQLTKEIKRIERKIAESIKNQKEKTKSQKVNKENKSIARIIGNLVGEFQKGIAEVKSRE